jgi:hypothetical protein
MVIRSRHVLFSVSEKEVGCSYRVCRAGNNGERAAHVLCHKCYTYRISLIGTRAMSAFRKGSSIVAYSALFLFRIVLYGYNVSECEKGLKGRLTPWLKKSKGGETRGRERSSM